MGECLTIKALSLNGLIISPWAYEWVSFIHQVFSTFDIKCSCMWQYCDGCGKNGCNTSLFMFISYWHKQQIKQLGQ